MSEHTPGPWVVDNDTACVMAPNSIPGDIVCMEPDAEASAKKWQANARLIAAAPDLLAALQGLCLYADSIRVMVGMSKTQLKRLDAGRAAIAKATGP